MQGQFKYALSIFLAMFIFGCMGILARFSGQNGLVIVFFASLFSCFGFFVLLLVRREFSRKVFSRCGWLLLGVGLLGIINNVTYFYAFSGTSISQAVFLHNLAPVVAVLLSLFIFSERMSSKKWFAVLIALVGIFLVSGVHSDSFGGFSTGNLFAIASAFAMGGLLIMYKKSFEQFGFSTILFSQMAIAVIVLAPFVFVQGPVISSFEWGMLLLIGLGAQFFAVILHVSPIKHLSVSTAALLGYLEPVFATLFAFLYLSESQTILTLFGGCLILLSSYLSIE